MVLLCCFFLYCSVICFRGRYHPQDSSKNKIINTAGTLMLGLFMALLLPTLFSFPQLLIFLLPHKKKTKLPSFPVLSFKWILKEWYHSAFLFLRLSLVICCFAEKVDWSHYSGLPRLALLHYKATFVKIPSIFWFSGLFQVLRRGTGLAVGFCTLHWIVFQLSNLPPLPPFSLSFLFFLPSRVFFGKSFLGFGPASVTIHSCTVWFKCFKLPVRYSQMRLRAFLLKQEPTCAGMVKAMSGIPIWTPISGDL